MIRNGAEAKDTVEEVYNSFGDLRTEDEKYSAVLYGRHNNYLLADLSAIDFVEPVAVPGPANQRWAADAAAELQKASLVFAAIPHIKGAQARVDAIELAAAWAWRQMDQGGLVSDAIVRGLVTRPFVGVWERLEPFDSKKLKDEEYLADYFPVSLEVDAAGRQSAFLETEGKIALAVRKVTRSAIDIAQAYNHSPEKDRTPAEIWGEDFPGLRVSFGMDGWSERDWMGKEITLWVLDDGDHQCHYVEGGGIWYPEPISNDKDNKPWSNPLGRPLFRFGAGYYNPDAYKAADRYMAWQRPLYRVAYQRDFVRSLIASYAASLPLRVLQVAPEVSTQLLDKSLKEAAEFLDTVMVREHQGIARTMGSMSQLDMPVPQALGEELQRLTEEMQQLIPARAPTDETLRNATASAMAIRQNYKEREYAGPKKSLTRIVHGVVADLFDLYRASDKSYFGNTQQASSPILLSGQASGQEAVKGKSIQPGAGVMVGPKELGPNDNWYDLVLEHIDMSASAVAARRLEAAELKEMRVIDMEQWLDKLGYSNTTEQALRLEVEEWKEFIKMPLMGLALTTAMRTVQFRTGLAQEELVTAAQRGLGAEPAPEGPRPREPVRVEAPRVDTAPTEVMG